MNKKGKKLALKFEAAAKRLTEAYLKIELPRIQRKAQEDALLLMHQSGKLKGTKIGDMVERNEVPWEGDNPQPLRAHMFEVEEILV